MAHLCEASAVVCEDFRLHQRKDGRNYIADFLKSLNADCDVISRAGGIQDLIRSDPGFDNELLRDLKVSVELHQVKTIHLVNHQDCGAYKPYFDFKSAEDEKQQHIADLKKAREIVLNHYPDVEVKMHYMAMTDPATDSFETIEVN